MKHTPGPWEVAEAGGYESGHFHLDEYFVRRPGDDVAIAADIIDPDIGEPSKTNAELIAAAPDLLAALRPFAQLALVLKEGQYLNYMGIYVSYEQVKAASDAVAKAPSNI